jgi:hypothetical protein
MAPEFSTEPKSFIMDNKLIREFGTDILCYRIRTARQKKRMRYKGYEKRLIKLDKERTRLRKQQRDLGWAPVNPPYQSGWKRFFVLRADVARSKQAEFFEGILKKINTYDWSYRKDFKIRRSRTGKDKYKVKEQYLLKPHPDHFAKLDFTDKEKQFFYEQMSFDVRLGRYIKRYVFVEPWRFELRIRPNMISKAWMIDPVLKSREKEIEIFFERGIHERKLWKLKDGAYRWGHWIDRQYEMGIFYKKHWKKRSLTQIMDEIKKD